MGGNVFSLPFHLLRFPSSLHSPVSLLPILSVPHLTIEWLENGIGLLFRCHYLFQALTDAWLRKKKVETELQVDTADNTFIHSFNKYLLRTYYVPASFLVLGLGR